MSNFLDDKLYNHVKKSEVKNSIDFKIMINGLYRICEDHWKSQVKGVPIKKEMKAHLDRTFKSWNSFIDRMNKDDYPFASLLIEYSYKNIFMQDKKLREIYEKL